MNVRDATLNTLRDLELTTIFGNPGSTEVAFLTDLPPDFEFVLGLHEGSVVGMATGYAIARDAPSFANLHTAAGLGNAINAIANARDVRAPVVVVVGQQARRNLAHGAFLTGRALERLAGEYLVWSNLPVRAQDVPGAIARAHHEAATARGPALVVVPMDDWLHEADPLAAAAPRSVMRPQAVPAQDMAELAELLGRARSPAIVVGAGAATGAGWRAVAELAEGLQSPVWQEAFGARAGFPQDHPQFAGYLPWARRGIRDRLAGHDAVLVIGTHAFRTYLFDDEVALVDPEVRVIVISEDPAEVHRSPCDVAVLAAVAPACAALASRLPAPEDGAPARTAPAHAPPPAPAPPDPGEPMRPGHVLAALAERLPADAVLVEETPSSRFELEERLPARSPLGFVANGNGALGFGFPGAIGLRMGLPTRPVLGVIGDGSAMYAIQALWSAAHYGVGVLLVVMSNGGYAIMDAQARERGGAGAWPGFGPIDIAGIAQCLGCPSTRIATLDELTGTLDQVLPGLAQRHEPLLLEVAVAP